MIPLLLLFTSVSFSFMFIGLLGIVLSPVIDLEKERRLKIKTFTKKSAKVFVVLLIITIFVWTAMILFVQSDAYYGLTRFLIMPLF